MLATTSGTRITTPSAMASPPTTFAMTFARRAFAALIADGSRSITPSMLIRRRGSRSSMAVRSEEGECYLTVFVKPVKGSPGELFDRAELAAYREKERRRRLRRSARS